jgi:hypothetical protein
MFFSRDIEFSSELSFRDLSLASDYFSKIQYLEKGRFFLAETFRIFKASLDLFMGKISDRKFSKMAITFE